MAFGEMILSKLQEKYEVVENDLKDNALLKKSGMKFALRGFDVKDLGHYFIMNMNGMMGAMKMETAVLVVDNKKVPLVNIDYVSVVGKESMMAEYYDLAGDGLPSGYQEKFEAIKKADAALENYKAEEQWYSKYLLPITYQKTGKKMFDHFLKVAGQQTDLFLEMTEAAQPADREERMAEALSFAQGLLDNGGPAINQFVKLFGRARTEQIVKECMYGVK
ncbi:MAG: hypothetical protein IJM79_05955 [Erysipelotrichaceae bacterium]|nr:hypothetical protein [Erysipelotrichaceae bacterium]